MADQRTSALHGAARRGELLNNVELITDLINREPLGPFFLSAASDEEVYYTECVCVCHASF